MINIIINEEFANIISEELIIQTANLVFTEQRVDPSTSVSIVIENDEALKKLNLQFRSIDSPTDVLSFPTHEADPEFDEYLGDIIISYPRALSQAAAANHTIECEMRLLVVHGLLHLLGFDHSNFTEQLTMWNIQDKILKPFGCLSPIIR